MRAEKLSTLCASTATAEQFGHAEAPGLRLRRGLRRQAPTQRRIGKLLPDGGLELAQGLIDCQLA